MGSPWHKINEFEKRIEALEYAIAPTPKQMACDVDWLDADVPAAWLADALDVVRSCPDLRFITVTKRPELFYSRLDDARACIRLVRERDETAGWIGEWMDGRHPHNLAVLATVDDQRSADERIPALLRIPAACHGLSVEPMLGPVDVSQWLSDRCCTGERPMFDCDGNEIGIGSCPCQGQPVTRADWVIVGGESGPKARPCNVWWIRDVVRQCKAAGVPVYVKQLGARPFRSWDEPHGNTLPEIAATVGEAWTLQSRNGSDPSEWPVDLRVREFPEALL